jgi:hypothetical protein
LIRGWTATGDAKGNARERERERLRERVRERERERERERGVLRFSGQQQAASTHAVLLAPLMLWGQQR